MEDTWQVTCKREQNSVPEKIDISWAPDCEEATDIVTVWDKSGDNTRQYSVSNPYIPHFSANDPTKLFHSGCWNGIPNFRCLQTRKAISDHMPGCTTFTAAAETIPPPSSLPNRSSFILPNANQASYQRTVVHSDPMGLSVIFPTLAACKPCRPWYSSRLRRVPWKHWCLLQ